MRHVKKLVLAATGVLALAVPAPLSAAPVWTARLFNANGRVELFLNGTLNNFANLCQDTGSFALPLFPGQNAVDIVLRNDDGGAIAWGYEILRDGQVVLTDRCGDACGIGCHGGTGYPTGLLFRHSFVIDSQSGAILSSSEVAKAATLVKIDDLANDQRFRVEVSWNTTQGGNDGLPHPADGISATNLSITKGGIFWFFDRANPEMLVKVLNGCGVNGKYWFFASAGTNVGFSVTVTDSYTGLEKTYTNPDRTPAQPVQDVSAFSCN